MARLAARLNDDLLALGLLLLVAGLGLLALLHLLA